MLPIQSGEPSTIMARDTLSSALEGSGFDYPPVPDVYNNPYSTSDTYNHNFVPALDFRTEPKPFSYPYYSNQVTASSTATVPFPSHSIHGVYGRVQETYTSMPSSVSYTGYGTLTSPAFTDYAFSNDNATNNSTSIRYVSHSAVKRKRPRGTTGTVICDQCDKKFTVRTSLNRHKKICRGRKPASEPRKSNKSKDSDIEHGSSLNALPAKEAGPAPSEEQSQDLGHNHDLHATSVTSTIGSHFPFPC